MASETDFYAKLPVFRRFQDLTDERVYEGVPEDWLIGLSDVVNSTKAIAAGRYKVVNTVGASVIAALTNALGRIEFPFSFGGDGAAFAVAPRHEAIAREALATTAAWARDELSMGLRTALVPVAAIRAAGLDVRVARFSPSPDVSYAMFSGGGMAWAETALKRGEFAIDAAPEGARPDLSGLSCRWQEMPSRRGVILSLVLIPHERADQNSFRNLVRELLANIENDDAVVSPVPEEGPALGSPTLGLDIETRVRRRRGQALSLARASLLTKRAAAYLIFTFKIPVGRFNPSTYRRQLVANSDFRKYDDGLRMTLDCSPEFASSLEQRLQSAQSDGIARFGLHRQAAAIMTCITPSVTDSRHVHFIDGAAGGYASAASRLKQALAASA